MNASPPMTIERHVPPALIATVEGVCLGGELSIAPLGHENKFDPVMPCGVRHDDIVRSVGRAIAYKLHQLCTRNNTDVLSEIQLFFYCISNLFSILSFGML